MQRITASPLIIYIPTSNHPIIQFRMFSRHIFRRSLVLPFLATTGLLLYNSYLTPKYKCCGILGVISDKNRAEVIVTEGIQLLQNRGYDSAGIVTRSIHDTEFKMTKMSIQESKKCIEKVVEEGRSKHAGSYLGLGHTRWATCGNICYSNAHPHQDQTHKYFLVHNGTIVNYKEIREKYLPNTKFSSQTDTEVIVQLLAKVCEEGKLSISEGMEKIKDLLIGQWGLVAVCENQPSEITIFTHGSPILVAFGEGELYIASETTAFQNYSQQYFSTLNEEIITLSLAKAKELKERIQAENRLITITNSERLKLKPNPAYRSFYEQQIEQQGTLLFKPYLKDIENANFSDNLTILGCGSSLHAALYVQYFLKLSKAFKKVIVLDASQILVEDIAQDQSIVLVSQSGETKDLLLALDMAKKVKGVRTICVVNVVQSVLARECDHRIFTSCGREVAVGATKSLTFQILNLLAMGVEIATQKGNKELQIVQSVSSQLLKVNDLIQQTIQLSRGKCQEIAEIVKNKESMYILAKGDALPIAKQGALKLKQLTYIHTEALGASEMKHGPIALINCDKAGDTIIFIIILKDKTLPVTKVALDEMHSRKAFCIVITDCLEQLNQEKIGAYIEVPKNSALRSLLCLYPFQILANEICVLKGVDPDKPRNLAKTVTV